MRLVKVGTSSVSVKVGDFQRNTENLCEVIDTARKEKVHLLVTPELAISGYSLEDRLFWDDIVEHSWTSLLKIAEHTEGIGVFVGLPVQKESYLFNATAFVCNRKIHGLILKKYLPTYQVFYEGRYWSSWEGGTTEIHGIPAGDIIFELPYGLVSAEICEDIWSSHSPSADRAIHGAEIICNLSASPFSPLKNQLRKQLILTNAMRIKVVYIYSNLLGCDNSRLIFDGGNEDEIIAYTYDKYLNGEGDEWPLLLPMVKSAVRAMDTIQLVQKDTDNHEIKRFVLTGGSKRGWTTWLTAATGDPRVVAIAPAVIDVLNMKQQMLHQLECYGTFSSEIEDYTRLKIPQRMHLPKGEQLLSIVDPYTYRNSLTLPKLILLGTNDPYWTVDSANLYFPDFPAPKYLCYQANTGHDASPTGIATLAEFFLFAKEKKSFPSVSWEISKRNTITVKWDNPEGTAYLWKADSNNRDFRNSKWESTPLKGKGKAKAKLVQPKTGWSAYYVEVRFPGSFGNPYSICTQMKVLPENIYPFKVDIENVKAIPNDTTKK